MSRRDYDFLSESILFDAEHVASGFRDADEQELRNEIERYREHSVRVLLDETPAAGELNGLVDSASADTSGGVDLLGQAALYFRTLHLPDPIVPAWSAMDDGRREATERALGRELRVDRAALARGAAFMKRLTPLVSRDFLRFVPSQVFHEPTGPLVLRLPQDLGAQSHPVIEALSEHVRIRKIVRRDGSMAILDDKPDASTAEIAIDFGQQGPHSFYSYQYGTPHVDDVTGKLSFRDIKMAPPATSDEADAWISHSIRSSAEALVRELLVESALGMHVNSFLITRCARRGAVLGAVRGPTGAMESMIQELEVPVASADDLERILDVRDRESAAFEAFRGRLESVLRAVRDVPDPAERRVRLHQAFDDMRRSELSEVKSKLAAYRQKGPTVVGAWRDRTWHRPPLRCCGDGHAMGRTTGRDGCRALTQARTHSSARTARLLSLQVRSRQSYVVTRREPTGNSVGVRRLSGRPAVTSLRPSRLHGPLAAKRV